MDALHESRVKKLTENIRAFYDSKTPFKVFHGSTNSTRVLSFKQSEMIDVSALSRVLSVDKKKMVAHVEPNVPMDALVKETLKYGLVPPVIMEFPGITVGGAIQGNGGESSSFKWGAFNQIFNSFEVITPDGNLRNLSATEDAELFHALPGTAGTLAVLTAAEIKLIPAKKYVRTEYIPVSSFDEAKTVLEKQKSLNIDFLDGIMFSKTEGVVITGIFSDEKQNFVSYRKPHDQWYYLHVRDQLKLNPNGWSETSSVEQYLFRYDRGGFWVGRFAFQMFNVPFNRFTRWLLDPLMHTRKMYQALQESGASQQHVVQDLVLPGENFVEFCDFLDDELHTYPLWLCPMLQDRTSPFQLNNLDSESIINVGVWGAGIPDYDEFIRINRAIETKVLELQGKKWSYAHSYFTDKEFWSMYDKSFYDELRDKYGANHLPDIYDKVTVKTRHPIEKKKAVLRTLLGKAKLRIEK